MTYDKFIQELGKLYVAKELPVRYFMQYSTFSYEIHNRATAFLGKPVFTSEVFWIQKESLGEILKHIKKKRGEIKNGCAKIIKLPNIS